MNTCFKCEEAYPDSKKVLFCPNCLVQVKCKSCSELLLKDAIGCIACGSPIEIASSASNELNQIEFEQKGETRKFKATFSDNVGHDLVATFGGMVGFQLPNGRVSSKKRAFSNLGLKSNSDGTETIDVEFVEDDNGVEEALLRIFKVDGESIVFQTSNFKSTSKLNKEMRIALLTLLGFKYIHKAEEIKRQTLTNSLKKFKLNSGGFRSWIGKSEEIAQKSGSMIFLTPNGLTTALEVLKEVLDPSIQKGTVKFSKGKNSRKKTAEGSSEVKKSSRGSKEYLLHLIQSGYFKEKRSLSDIVKEIKDTKAVTFKTTDISGHMGKLLGKEGLNREKGDTGVYEYFIK